MQQEGGTPGTTKTASTVVAVVGILFLLPDILQPKAPLVLSRLLNMESVQHKSSVH